MYSNILSVVGTLHENKFNIKIVFDDRLDPPNIDQLKSILKKHITAPKNCDLIEPYTNAEGEFTSNWFDWIGECEDSSEEFETKEFYINEKLLSDFKKYKSEICKCEKIEIENPVSFFKDLRIKCGYLNTLTASRTTAKSLHFAAMLDTGKVSTTI